ncbi:MAG: hypothetical protein RLZZ624_983 [Cyanobacteriota bacterium]
MPMSMPCPSLPRRERDLHLRFLPPWCCSRRRRWRTAANEAAGFSLLDALLAACLGSVLAMGVLQGLLADLRISQRLSRQIHERQNQIRLFDLLRSDLSLATAVSAQPQLERAACSLAGRQPVLHLSTAGAPITYSVGAPPSGLWRGQVLMRCGPAYGLEGSVASEATAVSRVVLDGLRAPRASSAGCPKLLIAGEVAEEVNQSGRTGLVVCLLAGERLLAVRVEQAFPQAGESAAATLHQEQLLAIGF